MFGTAPYYYWDKSRLEDSIERLSYKDVEGPISTLVEENDQEPISTQSASDCRIF
jgi:hypothetical protein